MRKTAWLLVLLLVCVLGIVASGGRGTAYAEDSPAMTTDITAGEETVEETEQEDADHATNAATPEERGTVGEVSGSDSTPAEQSDHGDADVDNLRGEATVEHSDSADADGTVEEELPVPEEEQHAEQASETDADEDVASAGDAEQSEPEAGADAEADEQVVEDMETGNAVPVAEQGEAMPEEEGTEEMDGGEEYEEELDGDLEWPEWPEFPDADAWPDVPSSASDSTAAVATATTAGSEGSSGAPTGGNAMNGRGGAQEADGEKDSSPATLEEIIAKVVELQPGFHSDVDTISVSSGYTHTCALEFDPAREFGGSVRCWGSNIHGESEAQDGDAYVQVTVGAFHSCALSIDEQVHCWGDMAGDTPSELFTQVSAGQFSTCGIRKDTSIACWGHATPSRDRHPTTGSFVQVSCGGDHCCAIEDQGFVQCWGSNSKGQLDAPENVQFKQVSASWDKHTCGITVQGPTVCWGNNHRRQSAPQLDRLSQVSAGKGTTCGIEEETGALRCWGRQSRPDHAAGMKFDQVSSGPQHYCAVSQESELECWGTFSPEIEEGPFYVA